MPPDPESIRALVREALTQFLADTRRPAPADGVRDDTVAYGSGGLLDSLGLVGFIADVEAAVAAKFGRDILLADERAMSRSRSPFRTPAALAELVLERLHESPS